tara:strand:+ start:1671 stop:1973 length:303 start_codon:yes stop_codon:yes gene_type:complete
MKKVTLTTILLILLTSISVLAQNEKNDINAIENLSFDQDAMTNQNLDINFEVTNSTDANKVSVIVKHETFKSTSRKSRMKNVVNFLKNPEKKQNSSIVLC